MLTKKKTQSFAWPIKKCKAFYSLINVSTYNVLLLIVKYLKTFTYINKKWEYKSISDP